MCYVPFDAGWPPPSERGLEGGHVREFMIYFFYFFYFFLFYFKIKKKKKRRKRKERKRKKEKQWLQIKNITESI